jgi:UDP-3-O-[3-hydroxymyristoyl] glucosamine N-acyltransferase
LVDDSSESQNALMGMCLSDDLDLIPAKLNINDLDLNADVLAALQGEVINLLSPQTFSLYRGKLYQLLSINKNIEPFINENISNALSVARWSFIGDGARVSVSAKVGLMTYIGPNAVIAPNAKIGNFCWIGEGSVIGSAAVIGNNVTIGDGLIIGPSTKVGKFNEIRSNIASNEECVPGLIELPDFYNTAARFNGL